MLQQSLPTWLTQKLPFDEILLLDWGGDQPVRRVMGTDERIVLVEVVDEPRWILSQAYNLGMLLSTGSVLYKLDTDYLLEPDFTQRYHVEQKNGLCFWAGNWRKYPRDDNRCNINGFVMVERAAFEAVGGYNERILNYGFDDEDLYERLTDAGFMRQDVEYGPIRHIKHGNEIRACGPGTKVRLKMIEDNREMARANPWTPADRTDQWEITQENDRHYVCKRKGA
jgi:hypothetical protein